MLNTILRTLFYIAYLTLLVTIVYPRKRLRKLEDKLEKCELQLHMWRAEAIKMFRDLEEDKIFAHDLSRAEQLHNSIGVQCVVPRVKLTIKDAIFRICEHLKIEFTVIDGTAPKINLVEKQKPHITKKLKWNK